MGTPRTRIRPTPPGYQDSGASATARLRSRQPEKS
jgi:hypothetical protein